jgi:hypothetical protein
VVRVGDELVSPFKISETGTDDKGAFAIVEMLGDRTDADKDDPRVVLAIDAKTGAVTLADPSGEQPTVKHQDFLTVTESAPSGPTKKPSTVSYAVRRTLAAKLSQAEVAEKADEAATTTRQISDVEIEKKDSNQQFASRLKDLRGQLSRLVEAHHTGEEQRSVDCSQVFCLKSGRTWFDFQSRRHEERKMSDFEVRETHGTLFGDAQIEDALKHPETKDGLIKPKTSEELARECGERAVAAADKREAKKAAKGKKSDTIRIDSVGEAKDKDIADVMRAETSKKTKTDHVST